jgi:hypothetical protein
MDARLALLAAALWAGGAFAQGVDHSGWDRLLKKHVVVLDAGHASRLAYSGVARERAQLRDYLASLSAVEERQFERWTRPQQMAFLINAYNAFAVEKVLTRYPDIHSIWDFGRLFGNPFKDRFFTLLGRPSSLDDVEHEMLRKRFHDPRIHFAVNCASVGCPMLREEAYAPERLERQLEEQAARFLSDRSRNRFAAGRLEVSRIFDWYKEDFEPRAAYFARYASALSDDPAAQKLIAEGRAPLAFLDYDWTLNDAR